MRKKSLKKANGPAALWLPWSLLLLFFWWLLVEGRVDSIWFAVPVIFFAYLARRALPTPLSLRRINLIRACLFVPVFVRSSVIAGLDVAWRALAPSLPIQPLMVKYPLRLRSAGPRVFLSQVISLMPGTLTCEMDDEILFLHALSGTEEKIIEETARLEMRVAGIFRENLKG